VIAGAATGLNQPYGVAVDANFIYVSNYGNSTITVYPLTASGNAAPVRTIGTGVIATNVTGLAGPIGIAVDANYIYVANEQAVIPVPGLPAGVGSITVYPLNASGNTPFLRQIGGYTADMGFIFGLVVDANYIYLAVQDSAQINIYPLGASGNVAPSILLSGSAQGLNEPTALAVDGTKLYVANETSPGSVAVFTLAGITSASTPSAVLSGASTGLLGPEAIAVDSARMYVRNANSSPISITDFPIAASGNTAPSSTLGGFNSGLTTGLMLAVDATVTPPATHFSISAPANATANIPFNITITALDASNNPVPSYAGTVHFTSSDSLAVLPVNTPLIAGTGTLSVTLKTGGSQTVAAADSFITSITGVSGSITVAGAAATHFTIVVPSAEVAGVPISAVVTARDAFNNLAAGYAGIVAFTSIDGAATLPANTMLTAGIGTVFVTLNTSGFQTVTGTDTVTPSITGTSNYVTVSPGAANHFLVTAPASSTAGNGFGFTVTALDAENNTVTAYGGTVHFTSSDGTATLHADTTLTAGTGTFLFNVLHTAGIQTISATDTVTPSITGTSSGITIGATGATHFSVSAPGAATVGTPVSVTVSALDPYNNVSPFYSGIAHFTSTDFAAVLPVNSTLASGIGTFPVTFTTSGGQTVTATDTVTASIHGTSGSVTVGAGASVATHFSVSLPGTAPAGAPVSVTVTALDASNVPVAGYTGTVHFTSSDSGATLPPNATLASGTGTFPITFGTPGGQTVTATDTVTASITGTSSAVTVSAAPATHFLVSAPGTGTAGTPVSVTVTALNASNATVPGYTGIVHFTSSDGSAILPANTTLPAGIGTFPVTLQTAGGQTVTATDTVTGSITGTSGTVTVGAALATHFSVSLPGTAPAGTPVSVTVTALNASNVTVPGYSGIVHFTSSDGSAVLPANTTLTAGVGTFPVTLQTAGGQTVTATDTVTGSITGTSSSVTVSAAPATHFSVSAPGTATAGTPVSVTVTALNASNVTVPGYTGTVHFTSSDGGAILPANATLASGVGTFPVTLGTAGGQTVTATDTVTGSITGTSSSVAVSAALPATHFSVSAPGTANVGTPISVTVTALNASNATVPGYTGTVHFTSSDGSAILPANATLTAGVGLFPVTLQTVGGQTVTATDTVTGSITGTSSSVAVSAALPATHFSVSAPGTATIGTPFNVTVTALNASNATVPGYTGIVHFTSSDGGAVLPANTTLTAGTGTLSVTLGTAGSQTVTATDTVTASITGTSGAVTVSAAPLPATHFLVSAPGTATASTPINVTVTALNSANAAVPGYTGTVHFTSSDGSAVLPVNTALTAGTGTLAVTLKTAGNQTITATDTASASITGTSGTVAVAAGAAVGVGGIGGGAAAGSRGLAADATGAGSGIAVSLTGNSGTLVGYLSSISAGFTANFTLVGGSFTTTTTALTGGASLGQSLTFNGTLSGSVLSGTILPMGAPFSVTLDPAIGASSAVAGLYQASSSTSGSTTYSIVGTQGELFVLAITPGLVSAGTGTVTTGDTFSVTTAQGTTITGSLNPGTTGLGETVTPAGGTAITFSGLSAAASPTVTPASQSVASGSGAVLGVTTSAASPTYQWQFNGVPIPGATTAVLSLPLIGLTQAGTYAAVVTSGGTSATSNAATVTVTSNAWLANLSCRAFVAPATNSADVLISGFITTGSSAKQLLVRGAGPGLQQFNIPGFLTNPSLTIFSGSTASATLTSWNGNLATTFASLGAFAFPANSADTATSNAYSPGAYSAVVSAADGKQSGVALVEVYDADHGAPTNRLVNLSGRALTGTGTNVLVGGFVVSGTTSETVLIRAVGPQLGAAPFNVPGTLAKPLLQVFDTVTGTLGNRVIAQIQGWGSAPTAGNSLVIAGLQPATSAVMASTGAFTLAAGSADSAMVMVVPPGAYTVQVSGADGGSGIALVEIYEVP
jgi:6-phosphogluconolactonase (cycloisomerase 2 family)